MADNKKTDAVAVLEPKTYELHAPGVITKQEDFAKALIAWQQHHYNVLCPAVNISGIAQQHGVLATMVLINPDPAAGEIYQDRQFCKDGEWALTKLGLTRIAQCAAISYTTQRTDNRSTPNLWEVQTTARWRGIDGSVQQQQATEELDLRDGSARIGARWTAAQVQGQRAKGLRHCESRSVNAAIRQYGVKQKYTTEELAKPFVCVRVAFLPDMNNPIDRMAVANAALAGTSALYPQTQPAALPPIDVTPERETFTPTPVTTPVTTVTAPPAPVIPDGAVLVRRVTTEEKRKKAPKTGTFTKWRVVDSNGAEHVTVNRAIGQAAQDFEKSQQPCVIDSELNGWNEHEIQSIEPWQAGMFDGGGDDDGGY